MSRSLHSMCSSVAHQRLLQLFWGQAQRPPRPTSASRPLSFVCHFVAMHSSPASQSSVMEPSPTPSTQSTAMDSSVESFHGFRWEALLLPGQEQMKESIASPRLGPARQRQRLDRAGAGRPAPRALQADLVDAEEAEPDARPEDMEPVLLSTQWRGCGSS